MSIRNSRFACFSVRCPACRNLRVYYMLKSTSWVPYSASILTHHHYPTDGAALEDLIVATNAVVVPVRAALAIAVASCSCTFGALACY